MQNGIYDHHWTDEKGNPAGGCSGGTGFTISWQNGPLGRDEDRIDPNGAFVEDVIAAVINRLEFYQQSKFNCVANMQALEYLQKALEQLEGRTKERELRAVEGTHRI